MTEGFQNIMFERFLFHYTLRINMNVVYSKHNEVHRTGEVVRKETEWSVLAPTPEHAHFAMMEKFAGRFSDVEPDVIHCQVTPVCAEIFKTKFK